MKKLLILLSLLLTGCGSYFEGRVSEKKYIEELERIRNYGHSSTFELVLVGNSVYRITCEADIYKKTLPVSKERFDQFNVGDTCIYAGGIYK